MKIDVATFGSATRDIFIRADSEILEDESFLTGKGVCFPLGSKVNVQDIFFTTGGGGTNSAVTFSKQGFKTAYLGKTGDDSAGNDILKVLKEKGVSVEGIKKTKDHKTNFSVVLDVKNKDRTILVYRGAAEEISFQDLPKKIKAKWFYLAPFTGKSLDAFYQIIKTAKDKDIKTAVNPSESQLKDKRFKDYLKMIDVLIVNQEEAAIFTGIDYDKEEQIFEKIDLIFDGIFVMTKGPQGLTVSDNENIFRVFSTPKKKVVDRTGAGDSFGSGFVSGLISGKSIEEAIGLGIGNATGCLGEKGAKNGLLEKGDSYEKMDVKITKK